jgi:hypothetical protein
MPRKARGKTAPMPSRNVPELPPAATPGGGLQAMGPVAPPAGMPKRGAGLSTDLRQIVGLSRLRSLRLRSTTIQQPGMG